MTVSIIGCGPSSKDWFNTPCDLSIGCNDCGKFGKDPDWLVVVNRKFTPEREAIIKASKPKRFLTTIDYWSRQVKNSETLQLQRYSKHLKKGHVYSSKTSPFIALSLAFNAGANNIILFGCDLNDHPVIKDKLRDYELRNFQTICRQMKEQGVNVWVSSKESSLSAFLPVYSPPKFFI